MNALCKQKKLFIFKLGLPILLMNLQGKKDIPKEQIDENIKRWTWHTITQEIMTEERRGDRQKRKCHENNQVNILSFICAMLSCDH